MASNLRTWRRPWESQPPGSAAKPAQEWLAKGLVALFDTRLGRELVYNNPASTLTSSWAASTAGIAADFSSTANQQYAHRPAYALTGEVTILTLLDVDALSGYGAIIAKQGTTTTNAPFELRLGAASTDSNINVLRANAGSFNSRNASLANQVAAGSRMVRLAVTLTGDLNFTVTSYSNGAKAQNVGAGGGSVTDNGAAVWIGRRYDGATQLDGRIYYVALVNRVLTESELAEWDANPWSIYEPRHILVPILPAASGTTISVPSGSLALTGYAPTVSATANQTIAVPAGALTLAGFAPTVNVGANQTISVPAGLLTMTGFAPTVNIGVNQNIAVPAGSLTLTGFAPTISASANQNIAVPVGSLTLTGFAPTVVQTAHQTISVPLGTLVMAGYAPTVSASGSYTISVPLGALVLTGYAPVVNNSGATVTVTVKLGSWIRYKKITAATSTLYGLDPTLNTGFFSYSGTNNLILTKLASSAANYLARSSAAKSSGLRYFAFVNTSESANDGTHIGVIQSSCPLSYPGADASGYGCQINRAAGVGLWNAGAFTALGGSALVGVGDCGMMAVNFTLGYIWYGRNGTWFNSGDPAAGTGPNQTFAPGTTFYAAVSEAYISVRTCYSLSGAPYAPPSGFSYWDA